MGDVAIKYDRGRLHLFIPAEHLFPGRFGDNKLYMLDIVCRVCEMYGLAWRLRCKVQQHIPGSAGGGVEE